MLFVRAMWGFLERVRPRAPKLAVALAAVTLCGAVSGDALATLESGKWLVKTAEAGSGRTLCLGDPVQLVRLEHPNEECTVETLASDAGSRTAQYTCAGRGYGHTNIRVETPRLATIETQGLFDGRPFSYRATARKVGTC
jgi:hypothetical protein